MDINLKGDLLDYADTIINSNNEDEREKALSEIKNKLGSFHISEISGSVDSTTLSTLYISQKLINDFWKNFGTDASFGIERVDIEDFVLKFAYFVKYGLEEKDNEKVNPLQEVIIAYYKAILDAQSKLDKEKPTDERSSYIKSKLKKLNA